jgi:hypothetical protein
MKKNILPIIISLSALLLLQCQYAKDAVKDLGDLIPKEKSEEENNKKVSSSSPEIFSSSSPNIFYSSSPNIFYSSSLETYNNVSSSSAETQKKRKEAK